MLAGQLDLARGAGAHGGTTFCTAVLRNPIAEFAISPRPTRYTPVTRVPVTRVLLADDRVTSRRGTGPLDVLGLRGALDVLGAPAEVRAPRVLVGRAEDDRPRSPWHRPRARDVEIDRPLIEPRSGSPRRPAVPVPWFHGRRVIRTLRRGEILVLAAVAGAGCGWLPPDSPPARPVAGDPDAGLFHAWKITGEVLGPRALISEADAAEFRERTVGVSATGYSSPWSGSCPEARREKQPRALAEVAAAHDLDGAANLGLAEPIIEYQLQCVAGRTPALTLYVAGPHAVTCWSGVCYLLTR
jgi:hypothetical protein